MAHLVLPPEEKNMKTQDRFAKVIEVEITKHDSTIENYQVVVMKDYDNEDDGLDVLWLLTNIDGTLVQTRAGFKDVKIRDKAFNEYDKVNATKFVNESLFMLK
jgi:hypothetical protein